MTETQQKEHPQLLALKPKEKKEISQPLFWGSYTLPHFEASVCQDNSTVSVHFFSQLSFLGTEQEMQHSFTFYQTSVDSNEQYISNTSVNTDRGFWIYWIL